MTITTRQDKILAIIERAKARLEKLQSAEGIAKAKKKYGTHLHKHFAYDVPCTEENWVYWHKCDIEEIEEQIANNYKKLEEAKRLDAKEEEKLAKKAAKENKVGALPEILVKFHAELLARVTKSNLERWELFGAMAYPEWRDNSAQANAIRWARNTTREQVEKDCASYCEALVLNFFDRVCEKVGNITELNLFINDGNWAEGNALNGTVKGDKGSCRVESITAGGYNIQRLHVRVLVK